MAPPIASTTPTTKTATKRIVLPASTMVLNHGTLNEQGTFQNGFYGQNSCRLPSPGIPLKIPALGTLNF
jgi:hypothetical protein